jgi:hypothetical protein
VEAREEWEASGEHELLMGLSCSTGLVLVRRKRRSVRSVRSVRRSVRG